MNTTSLIIANQIPLVYIGLIVGFVLIFAAGFLRSPLLWIAALVCFIGVYFEPELFDTYYQVTVRIVMIFCLLMCTFHYQQKRSGRG